ncbi:MAG TPA: phosphomannomutase/phosphoglucomutase, partial [Candidatus Staskawiczbacteria bacterium]|nr:phosphomannomutase/phosphoglucomutase [Candidatus Staskawiczbacteria bacterium]
MDNINKEIFKSYDVRGIYPGQLNEAVAFNIGKAFAKLTGAKKVAVANDARISGPELLSALARGVISEGGQLSYLGQLPTECLYFAVGNYDFSTGIMITASHNPKEYNGFKMIKKVDGNIEMIRGTSLADVVGSEDYTDGEALELNKKDILKDYANHILRFVDLSQINPLKIVIDASSGVAGKIILEIQDKLPVEIIPLNFEPNGEFPNHSPNPLADGSAKQISDRVKAEAEGVDFGLIFDGDADRVFLVDGKGQLVRADVVLLILARYFLKKNAGSAIAYNAICSKAVPEFIKKWGGSPIKTKVGFVNVREGLLQNNGVMGGELSGHYCFKDNFYMDSGMIAMLILMQEISADGRKVSEIVAELSPYAKGAELNFEVADKDAVLERIKEKFS